MSSNTSTYTTQGSNLTSENFKMHCIFAFSLKQFIGVDGWRNPPVRCLQGDLV